MHRFLLHNGKIHDAREPLLSPGQIGFLNGWGVFSTLRVSRGVLFAYERHFSRMKNDALRMRVPFELSSDVLRESLLELAEANGATEATLRVCVVRNTGGLFQSPEITRPSDLVAFTADLRDWGVGVSLRYIPHGRHAKSPFAGTKVTSWAQNLTWYEQAHADGFDEVILLNEDGQVSECTSANIFAIQGNYVLTPPVRSSGCLPGVTRALLLEEIQVAGLHIQERELMPSELEASDGVFITSTTRDLLPVLAIDGTSLKQASAKLDVLQRKFQEYRAGYVSDHLKRPLLV